MNIIKFIYNYVKHFDKNLTIILLLFSFIHLSSFTSTILKRNKQNIIKRKLELIYYIKTGLICYQI
jgi:hypothetical protein